MFWRKLSVATQAISLTVAVIGVAVAAAALARGHLIPIPSILISVAGCAVGFCGLLWEEFLDGLDRKREEKKIRKNANEKSA